MSEFGIQYKLRLAKKGQVLADFLAEIPLFGMSLDNLNWWTLNVDGVSQQTRAGIGFQHKSPAGEKIEQVILAGIELAATVSTDKLLIQSDSQLVVG